MREEGKVEKRLYFQVPFLYAQKTKCTKSQELLNLKSVKYEDGKMLHLQL